MKGNRFDELLLYVCFLSQIIFLIGIYYDNKIMCILTHFIFAGAILIIPLFSQNKYMLALCLLSCVLAMATRKISGKCMFRMFDKHAVEDPVDLDWDYIFPFVMIITVLRWLYYSC
jgi:hypothetical protein